MRIRVAVTYVQSRCNPIWPPQQVGWTTSMQASEAKLSMPAHQLVLAALQGQRSSLPLNSQVAQGSRCTARLGQALCRSLQILPLSLPPPALSQRTASAGWLACGIWWLRIMHQCAEAPAARQERGARE